MKYVLIVEDDPLSVEFLKIFLEASGYTVGSADSVGSFASKLKERTPQIVLTDIELPDGSGVEIAQLARAVGISSVYAVSGYSRKQLEDRNIAVELFSGFFTKPVDLDQISQTLGSE